MGPTLVWYLLRARATVEEPTVALPRAAAGAATAAAARGAAAGSAVEGGAALEPPAGRGEERCTQGRKALPPRVFTILKPEKENKGVGRGVQMKGHA